MRYAAPQRARQAALVCLVGLALAAPAIGREWSTVKNLLKIEGDLVAFDGKVAKLKIKGSDKAFAIPIEKLSEADQQYLKTTYPNGLADPKAKDSAKKPADGTPAEDTSEPAKTTTAARPVTNARTPGAKSGKADGISVEVVSLTVTKPPKNGVDGAQLNAPGTHITLLLSDPSRTITGLDSEKSKITECIDDKRTNLAKPASGDATSSEPGMLMLAVAPDGKSGTIEVDQPRVPDAKASRIRIRGELHVTCGDGENAETVKVPISIILGLGL